MKTMKTLAIAVGISLFTLSCMAQEDEEAPTNYIYSTYFLCGGGPLSRVDELTAETAPIMDKLVEDGEITGWGWYGHHTGGRWQRLTYHTANSMDQLLDGADAIQAALDAANDDDADDDQMNFGQICYRHDDYIWRTVIGTGGGGDASPKVGFSSYHVCDVAREERADEIVKELVAPIMAKLVEDGKLIGWGWSVHEVGGRFRKLQTMVGTDHKAVLKARAESLELIYADDNAAGVELTDICGAHVDYMWDIIH